MSLEVLVPAPTTALTTLVTMKQWLGIQSTDQDDNIIAMIQAASDYACRYCGRQFAKEKVEEGMPGKGVPDILLSLTPIIEIESISLRNDELDPDSYEITDHEAGIVQTSNGFHGSYFAVPRTIDDFPSTHAREVYFVIYTGGYVLPGWDATEFGPRTLPYDLERAIIDTVSVQYRTNLASLNTMQSGLVWDGVMQSYKIGDTSVTWGNKNANSGSTLAVDGGTSAFFPQTALAVLNYYRRAF